MSPMTSGIGFQSQSPELVTRRLTTLLKENNFDMNQATSALNDLSNRIMRAVGIKTSHNITLERKSMVTVEVKCTFLKIGDIDTPNQNFQAEILVQAKWEEPALDFAEKNKQVFNTNIFWEPKLVISNVIKDFDINQKNYNIFHKEEGYNHAVVVLLWRFMGKFRENLELEQFPFDVQELTIQLTSERSIDEIDLIEDRHSMSTVNVNMFQDAQEWSIYHHVECVSKFTTVEYASTATHPVMLMQTRVRRKFGFFFWNVVVIVTLILALTFGGLSIDANNPDRMGLTITLFLTSVAFKLVIKSTLPTISYLTYLDIYMLGNLLFLALQSAECAMMCWLSKWLPLSEVILWDNWTIGSLAILLIAFHLILGILVYNTALKKRRKMRQMDRDYDKRRAYMENHGVLLTRGNSSLAVDKD
ncbi:cys-loop ligand-gated ion channel-like [Gigantopelta aegis]|uniref:cys-loop ligand-gated ion channel-like n=1 Tax=Gigantopelta aegis TaxID=1735272 RepID=UPI001B88DE0F|nr:cys-loop ligand-gated ion channel-like [Gigantopelta aegis]